MGYYDEKQFLAAVDEADAVTGKVEKWEAHRNSILHRGYTAIVFHQGKVALQHRKHPVFDDVFDLSFSSHQLYIGDRLQTSEEAIADGLLREWGLTGKDLVQAPSFVTKVYYQAKDPHSDFSEHEIDYIFRVESSVMPVAKSEFAYGSELVSKEDIVSGALRLRSPFAPWVKTLLARHAI